MTVPEWVQDSIFYQIFPDRFCNGSVENDPKNVHSWSAMPTISGFQGGDIRGIIERVYYLMDLGVNAIYLNPIFLSPSNHRYNAVDYYQIDPKLGTKTEFLSLLDIAHRNNMKIILDGVFNHCGRGFFAFNDILENQASSPYLNWFHVRKFPVDAYSPGEATSYEGWWKYKSLPKFNTSNPDVRKYLLDVARFWVEKGIDGWRLDVPNEIDDDSFWLDFRNIIKKVNSEAYLLGEIWDGNPRWVGEGHFDGLMNYPVRTSLVDLLTGKSKVSKFSKDIVAAIYKYPHENSYAMYGLLGSHDTERFLTVINGDLDKAKFAYLFMMTYPGAPAIYYGDEIGLLGKADPDCRRTFPWDETNWNTDLRYWIKKLIWLRKERISLRRGDLKVLHCEDGSGALAYTRTENHETTVVVLNASGSRAQINVDMSAMGFPEGSILRNLITFEEYKVDKKGISVSLGHWSGLMLARK
jgi:cyclomaltodextrinase